MVGAGPWGRGAAAGAEVGDGLIVELSGCCSEIGFRPSNSEPGMAILAVSACSRRKLGALCWRGLSWVQGCLWARLLGVLDSEALLGTRGSRVCGWEAASWGTGAVEGWANVPGVLVWESRCSGVWVRGDTLLASEPTKPLSVSGDAIQGSSRGGPPAWHRDFRGRRSEMLLPSRLVRLLWWDTADLVLRGWGCLLGP